MIQMILEALAIHGGGGVQEAILPLILGAVAAAGSIASSVAGAVKSSKAAKKAKSETEQEARENENWYNRRYNEDYTQRADAQRILTQTKDYIKNSNRAAAGQQAVTGGTEESVAATKAANAKALADATSQIAANGEAEKDKVEERYLDTKRQLNEKLEGIEQQRAGNIANATSQASSAMANIFQAAAQAGDPNAAGSATGATTNAKLSPLPENAALKEKVQTAAAGQAAQAGTGALINPDDDNNKIKYL